MLQTIIQTGLDIILPLKSKTVYPNEPPWINPTLKKLIKKHQRALNQGDHAEFKLLRNRVNRERKMCRSKYYECRVQHLKECSPAGWWAEIKRLGGVTNSSGTRNKVLKSIQHHLEGVSGLSPTDLANHVNTAFLAPTESFEPLTYNPFRDSSVPSLDNSASDEVPVASELSVLQKLLACRTGVIFAYFRGTGAKARQARGEREARVACEGRFAKNSRLSPYHCSSCSGVQI